MYIAIAGNIGSGKSYLAELLGRELGWEVYMENSDNPYIADFYNDMPRWALNMQVYFLGKRLRQIQQIVQSSGDSIIDRTIYEDAEVFSRTLHSNSLMPTRDWDTFMEIYDFATASIPRPDLLIYIKASAQTLAQQIKHRGREYEQGVDLDYLELLSDMYSQWMTGYDGESMVVDLEQVNFVSDPIHRHELVDAIKLRIKELNKVQR